MTAPAWLWAVFTVTAAGGQTLRNAFQHDLVDRIGAANAAFVRFLFGFPFAVLCFAALWAFSGAPAAPGGRALALTALAATAQVAATALMLVAMREKSFVVATALTKTEAVQIVLFGMIFLSEKVSAALLAAVTLTTLGVLVAAAPTAAALSGRDRRANARGVAYGLASAAMFGVSTIAFREGLLALETPSFLTAAVVELALALTMQTAAILLYLVVFDRAAIFEMAREWRVSLLAGGMGVLATLFWFLAFTLAGAAQVRTLALIETPMAHLVSRRMFKTGVSGREWAGLAMILAGVVLALNGA